MYYVLYDKDFNALGTRKTYPCSSWSIRRKANEFDEIVIEGIAIENDDKAVFVGLHDELKQLDEMDTFSSGTLKALAFSGIPDTKDGKTKINAIDIRHLLKNSCVIDLTRVVSVEGLYRELLTCLFNTDRYGYGNIGVTVVDPDLTETCNIELKQDALEAEKKAGSVWSTLQVVNSVYDCYIEARVNFIKKTVQFAVRHIKNFVSIKLEDFGVSKVKRDDTVVNRAVCYAEGIYDARAVYYLQTDDSVVEESEANPGLIAYPVNVEVYEAETLEEAKTKGIQELYKNRFKANVEVPLDNQLGYVLNAVDLSYMVDIYEYKKLPVMETYEDSKGERKIKMGRLEEYWWQ